MKKTLLGSMLALTACLTSCADYDSHPVATPLRTGTAIERRATLSILRRAWDERPPESSDDHCWYERRLLDRSAFFGRKIHDTETYREACSFWMGCVREHVDRYDDPRYQQK